MSTTLIHQRYAGAWAELNTRLQSRQIVLTSFTIATGTALATFFGTNELDYRIALAAILPFASMAFALWVRHNDTIIGILGRYCGELERHDKTSVAWHDKHQGWVPHGLLFRYLVDIGFVLVVVISCFPDILVLFQYAHCLWTGEILLAAFSLFVGLAAGWIVAVAGSERTLITKSYFDPDLCELIIGGRVLSKLRSNERRLYLIKRLFIPWVLRKQSMPALPK